MVLKDEFGSLKPVLSQLSRRRAEVFYKELFEPFSKEIDVK